MVIAADGARSSADDIIRHVKATLASYKAPKQVVIVDTVPRAPNGKADYKTARQIASEDVQ